MITTIRYSRHVLVLQALLANTGGRVVNSDIAGCGVRSYGLLARGTAFSMAGRIVSAESVFYPAKLGHSQDRGMSVGDVSCVLSASCFLNLSLAPAPPGVFEWGFIMIILWVDWHLWLK